LLETIGKLAVSVYLLMDKAYADWKTRWTAWSLRFNPVVPPKSNAVGKRALKEIVGDCPALIMFDRNYASLEFVDFLEESGVKYLIRLITRPK
jgi:hypothetical protein